MGNYTLGEMIGKGGMGTVYRAHHEGLDIDVAVKFIHPYLVDDEEIVQRFLREARLSAKINHPNVRRTLDCGREEDGRPFIVMEYLDGESLRERIKRGPIPEAEALAIAKQILAGLAAAHAMDVVHRDIKPGNVFICRDGTVKLVDFGIAKALGGGSLTGTGAMIGTPEYMSPEQAEGGAVDGRSDLYSLGIVLYEMLAGDVPFKADTPLAVLKMQVDRAVPELDARVGRPTRDAIAVATQKAPYQRFRDAATMGSALRDPDFQASTSNVQAGPRQSPTQPAVLVAGPVAAPPIIVPDLCKPPSDAIGPSPTLEACGEIGQGMPPAVPVVRLGYGAVAPQAGIAPSPPRYRSTIVFVAVVIATVVVLGCLLVFIVVAVNAFSVLYHRA